VNSDTPRLRLSILGVVVFSLFAALFARLWYLQVMVSDQYQVAADANRIGGKHHIVRHETFGKRLATAG